MFSSIYFNVQSLTFAGLGIRLQPSESCSQANLIKHPLLLYGMLFSAFFHLLLVSHYAGVHITDFVEISDSLPLLCQLVLCILKMLIFLKKRQEILLLIKDIQKKNEAVEAQDMYMVQWENRQDNFLCSLYFRVAAVTGSCALLHPVIYGLYVYFSTGEIVLVEPNKSSYFWNHSHLAGYSVVYVLNLLSVYFTCTVSLAFDTLFCWFVSNIVAQFHIINKRFERLARNCCKLAYYNVKQRFHGGEIAACLRSHHQILYLTGKLNRVYGAMISIKFLIACVEICSLIFRLSRPNDSPADVAYKSFFLCAVALQLILYCWNGQRIKDSSLQVNTAIYCAFDWHSVPKCYKNLLLFSMMRSQKSSLVTGVFFEVDLGLYLWVFKTAGSLYTALKTLDENQI